jgi:hypothetical protein
MTVSRKLSKHKLDLVGVQKVRWECGGNELAGDIYFSMEREMRNMN